LLLQPRLFVRRVRLRLIAFEQPGRVVLDLQHAAAGVLVRAGERVAPRLEPEAQEIGGRDELRLAREAHEGVDVGRRRRLGVRAVTRVAPLRAVPLAGDPAIRVARALGLRQRDAVETQGAADEEPVADVPRVLAREAEQAHAAGAGQRRALLFV